MPGMTGNPGSDGFARLKVEIPSSFRAELANGQRRVNHDRVLGLLENWSSLNVQLVANFSDNFFKNIFKSDDAEHGFVNINDDREVPARRAKKLHHCRQRRLLKEGQHRADEGLK